jgi:hypothetical protein
VPGGATIRTALRVYRARTTGERGRRSLAELRWGSIAEAYPDVPEPQLARLWLRACVMFDSELREVTQDSPPERGGAANAPPVYERRDSA